MSVILSEITVHLTVCPDYKRNTEAGGWINIKMPSYQYRKSHCGDKTTLRPSYLHNEISYTGKTTSLYWIGTLCIILVSMPWRHHVAIWTYLVSGKDLDCNRYFIAGQGVVESPYLSTKLLYNLNCVYVITNPNGRVALSFETFDLGNLGNDGHRCTTEFVQVQETIDITRSTTTRYCIVKTKLEHSLYIEIAKDTHKGHCECNVFRTKDYMHYASVIYRIQRT